MSDDFLIEFERLVALHPNVALHGYADEADPPVAYEQPEFRDFVLALVYLSKRAPDGVTMSTVASRASHALYEFLLGDRLTEGGITLAAYSLGYDVTRLQEGGAWLACPKDENANH